MDWFDREMEALEQQLRHGEIDMTTFRCEVASLRRDAQEQEDRESIIAAGRGHLLK